MKILLFGKNGQVGWELQRSLAPLGELVALDRHSRDYCGDLADAAGIADTIRRLAPDAIVNAAAYTAVDKAESDAETAQSINASAPQVIAEQARLCGAWLVHYSTDYVFDGSGERPWLEDDAVNPLGIYGRSKLAGEQAIQASGAKHLIFRTSWVYAARGNNFAKTMLRLAREREQLAVIADQIGAPTGAELIADVTAHALRATVCKPDVSGVYHLASAGATSWHAYAQHVFSVARQHGEILKAAEADVKAIATSEYPTAAQRPLNSRLNTQKLQTTFNLQMPDWQMGVERMLAEILGN
ncbi:dTDP-4-dehydrorhamnose reductase [Methylomonas sp. LWB]|uniref:dTDP-4-dehydrorhamnose reductase n=1 Tax=unclassified Methylomonas TaxID=2608980 RepID=UPI0008D8DD4D|nr:MULTISPECIES: dTDP-4-dehydrorhamnose reductase [unclassified Methylomonas]MDT4328996.1 dTDP-4-dehydrorhamnose reductase [Methylomonas sp. MV1]OHX35261.1 dTDP-4-dehydrorhamnose reductase [Methylomonas sp. LWB]